MVNDPSEELTAAKADNPSGLGTSVDTLISPKVDLLPS